MAVAQRNAEVTELQRQVKHLQERVQDLDSETGMVVFLFGAFCALWAQNNGRNPWLWFLLGAFFSVVTVLFVLAKNPASRDFGPVNVPEREPFDLERFRKQ